MKEILYIIALSSGSIVTLLILTKLMGNREMSQLSMFDYINGITIGSIAAEMATSLEDNFMQPLVAMIVYAAFNILFSIASNKSLKARQFIEGKPYILLNNDMLYEKNFKKAKMDICEFQEQARVSGYFDLSQIKTAVLESNGKISFLPKSEFRPINPKDIGLHPINDTLVCNLIIDGKFMEKNIRHSGKNVKWVQERLKSHNIKSVDEVLLATCDLQNNFTVYKKNNANRLDECDILN